MQAYEYLMARSKSFEFFMVQYINLDATASKFDIRRRVTGGLRLKLVESVFAAFELLGPEVTHNPRVNILRLLESHL